MNLKSRAQTIGIIAVLAGKKIKIRQYTKDGNRQCTIFGIVAHARVG